MKIVQANVWGGRLENQLVNFFEKEQPDIACLQEAISIDGNGAIFKSFDGMRKSWKKATYAYHTPMFSFNFMNRIASFGNGIISTFPITKEDSRYVRLEHIDNFDFDEHDYNVRNFQHVELDVKGKPLHVINHHGHHIPDHKNGDAETLRHMAEIADYIKKLDGPIILTGDFNLSPHSESLEIINNLLKNLSIEYGLKSTRNNLTHKKEVCDYIFVNDQVKVRDFKVSDELVSDHKALVLEFDI